MTKLVVVVVVVVVTTMVVGWLVAWGAREKTIYTNSRSTRLCGLLLVLY